MSMPSLTRREFAYLSISGPGTHETVTERLGLKPTEAWNIGDINPRTGEPRRFMRWQLKSGLDDTRSLDEHITSLLHFLGHKASEMRQLWVDYDLVLECVGYSLRAQAQ